MLLRCCLQSFADALRALRPYEPSLQGFAQALESGTDSLRGAGAASLLPVASDTQPSDFVAQVLDAQVGSD